MTTAVLYAEWARHAAWRALGRLATAADEIEFGADPAEIADRLEASIEDVRLAIDAMRAGERPMEHYER